MAQLTIDAVAHAAFAVLSGDANPIHTDPMHARRSAYGAPIAHGAHVALAALGALGARMQDGAALTALQVKFQAPVYPGDPLTSTWGDLGQRGWGCEIDAAGRRALSMTVDTIAWTGVDRDFHAPAIETPIERTDFTPRQLESIDLACDTKALMALHPGLKAFPASQLCMIVTLSRLIGMRCPGLYSIWADLKLRFEAPLVTAERLDWFISAFDARFGHVAISTTGAGASADVQAFRRPRARRQISAVDLRARVTSHAGAQEKAVVIGGSRGLGELSAKILAAHGLTVILTYARGEEDARRVRAEIVEAGGAADIQLLNVRSPSFGDSAKALIEGADLALYFASPAIFRGGERLNENLLEEFFTYYVTAFETILTLAARKNSPLRVFYPSTTAIDEHTSGLKEYILAKAAGEALCAFHSAHSKNLDIHIERLPRLETDQTLSVIRSAANQDTVEYMLSVMNRLIASKRL